MPPHGIGLSVKMTVDNNAVDPDIPGYPALLSTGFSGAGIIFHRHCPGWCLQQWITGIIRNPRSFRAKTGFVYFLRNAQKKSQFFLWIPDRMDGMFCNDLKALHQQPVLVR